MRLLLLLLSAILLGWLVVTRLLPPAAGGGSAGGVDTSGSGLPPLRSTTVPGQALERARQIQDLNNRRQAEAMRDLP